ncbi:hypothetical protein [Gorillibacterium sp. sgz500922]|uniref:hypothetical protein n=1 Tax=Gorillibacterium sp. sgz500922 TaxID=3446694 RepID=UPI003F6610D9
MEETLARYYELKEQIREAEKEVAALRETLIGECRRRETTELTAGGYRLKLIAQERKEYDDHRLYESLPDPDVWRLASKADPGKIASLLKLGVLKERLIAGTYTTKEITLVTVERQ